MARNINRVVLWGVIGKEPKVSKGETYSSASVSVTTVEMWKDKNTGERKERSTFTTVQSFDDYIVQGITTARIGQEVYVEGKLSSNKYTDKKDGIEKWATVISIDRITGRFNLFNSDNKVAYVNSMGNVPNIEIDDEVPF